MNLKEQRAEALKNAGAIMAGAKAAGRTELSDEEYAKINEYKEEVKSLDVKLAKAGEHETLMKELGALGESEEIVETKTAAPLVAKVTERPQAKSLGEHFVTSRAYEVARERVANEQVNVSATEFEGGQKAAPFFTSNTAGLVETQYGRVVPTNLQRPTIADLMPNGQLDNKTLTYWVQGAMATGASSFPGITAEGGLKPELGFSFAPVVESLRKIAGWTQVSDEALTDTPYMTSVINNQLLLRLALAEEQQLLNGASGGTGITGLLNRTGVQTGTGASAASGALTTLDAIYHASTQIQTAVFFQPDGIVISPNTYEKLRLAKDLNNQYFGGGPFTGAYGVGGPEGGFNHAPGLWTWNTVVTTAISDNTILVGNFSTGAAVWRAGGVRVDSTNLDQDDFINNRVKIRAEERLLLQVEYPAAFVKISLS